MPQTRNKKKNKGQKLDMSATNAHEEDSGTAAADENTPLWAKHLIATFNNSQLTLNTKLEEINNTVQSISNEFKELNVRVTGAEKRISDLEDNLEKEKRTIQALHKQVSALDQKIDNLEAHSRRNNIRIMGLKEGTELDNLTRLLDHIFRYILDLEDSAPSPEVDRAHRAGRPRPNSQDAPRTIIVRLLRWKDKQNLLMAVKKKGRLQYDEQPFFIRQDMTAEVRRQRAVYNDIIEELKRKGIRAGVLYPARLIVTIEGKTHLFNTPEEARRELSKLLRGTREFISGADV